MRGLDLHWLLTAFFGIQWLLFRLLTKQYIWYFAISHFRLRVISEIWLAVVS